MTTGLKILDWDGALEQVGGGQEYLDEIFGDLMNEAEQSENEIGAALKIIKAGVESTAEVDSAVFVEAFKSLRNAAHRIKGSASYLCCQSLESVSLQLQKLGQEVSSKKDGDVTKAEVKKKLEVVIPLFDSFVQIVKDIKVEVARKKQENKAHSDTTAAASNEDEVAEEDADYKLTSVCKV